MREPATDETPEDRFQRWLAENPPAPRVPPRISALDRAVFALILVGSIIFWGGIAYAMLRPFLG